MKEGRIALLLCVSLALAACKDEQAGEGEAVAQAPVAGAEQGQEQPRGEAGTAGDFEFPAIPQIVVPDIVGVGPAQQALEASLQGIIDPLAGISVRPATCSGDGALINDAGITSVDEQGRFLRTGRDGIFDIDEDGSGTAVFEGGIITVEADGSGTINGKGADGRIAQVMVEADGSGSYNGPHGQITLDGKGEGSWNGRSGQVSNNGDGSGSWNGPLGQVEIRADGSGTWNGPHGLVENYGNGRGRIGTPGREVAMAPLPPVPPAGKFPPLQKFAPPGAPCGYVITLNDRVLFDFDKADIRPDAAAVLDVLAAALSKVSAASMEVRGHTDAKGSDAYNQDLSERRARAVVGALRERGAGMNAEARGYGESQPVAPNQVNGKDNPSGRQLNRRVEIFVRS